MTFYLRRCCLSACFLMVTACACLHALEHKDLVGWWVFDGDFIKGVVAEMEKGATEEERKQLRVFVPFMEKMMAQQTAVFSENEFISHRKGREQRKPYTIKTIEGNTIVLEISEREMEFVLEAGRLVHKRELGGKRPPMYMRKLSPAEVVERKKIIDDASRPPPATETPDKRLSFLVYRATPEQVDRMLADQEDLLTIRETRFRKGTAVHMAAKKGDLGLLRKLLDAGADADATDSEGRSALFACVQASKPARDVLDLLIARGVDVNRGSDNDETALMTYCGRGKDVSFLKHLLTLGIDVNRVSKWKRTALTAALEHGWMEGAQALISAGADVTLAKGALQRVVREGNLPVIKLLLENGVTADQNGETALMHAVRSTKAKPEEILPLVLSLCKDTLEARDSQGKTVLFHARDLATVKLLIAAGADVNARSNFGDSLLHSSAGSAELLAYYVEEGGLKVDCVNERKQTPLQFAAAAKENLAGITYLVDKGADINHGDRLGATPLSWALSEKSDERLEYVKYLLASGADPNIPSPLECIKEAVTKDFEEALRLLVKSGMSLKTDPKEHYTPFWYAVFAKRPKYVTLLIELGADPNAKNAVGKTALDIAKEFKNAEVIELLSR